MTVLEPSPDIAGMVIARPDAHTDERGRFVETYRVEWFPGTRPMVQGNHAERSRRTLVGLHYHLRQTDYWYVVRGHARAVFHDLRAGSPTEGATASIDLGEIAGADHNHLGLLIPPGVAHGIAALTDVSLTYLVDATYDPADELARLGRPGGRCRLGHRPPHPLGARPGQPGTRRAAGPPAPPLRGRRPVRYLVTGGAGFVGSTYVRHLLATSDHQVTVFDALTYAGSLDRLRDVLDDPRVTFVHGDVAASEDVAGSVPGHDVIVHFAAESHVDRSILDPTPFERSNVRGTEVVCREAVRTGVGRFLHVSTDEVYGPIDDGAFDEAAPLSPTSPYARSKARSDEIALAHGRDHGLPVIITRSSNQFGPWQFPEKLIPLFVSRLLAGGSAPVYGDGLQRRDWLHVLDNCSWIDATLAHGTTGEIYNIAGHHERTNLEVADLILATLGLDRSRLEFVADRPLHDRRYAITTTKVEKLAPVPVRPFEDALEQTVRWYVDHQEWWQGLLSRVRNR
ncbi:dTDP-glucose 4,6-dehydratase [Aquihabitans daechungensis]|uniref:dTDP-glucose 4,6-dehydratase n=1 Tax=Aquihabitans daechungensis TaxID=1052257 RepID=UPI003B9E6753